MRTSESIGALAAALAKFQGEVKNPSATDVNPQFRSRYSPLDVVINTVKPVLAKNGLSFIQSLSSGEENVSVTTLLLHESGEWIESDPLTLPAYQTRAGGVKEYNAHGVAIGTTYGRRISLASILGLSSEEDDDANGQVFGDNAPQPNKPAPNKNSNNSNKPQPSKPQNTNKPEKAENHQENTLEKTEESAKETASSDDKILDGQLTALNRMIELIAKKREDFDKDNFTKEVAGKFGKESLSELTQDQGKEVLTLLNVEMRKK